MLLSALHKKLGGKCFVNLANDRVEDLLGDHEILELQSDEPVEKMQVEEDEGEKDEDMAEVIPAAQVLPEQEAAVKVTEQQPHQDVVNLESETLDLLHEPISLDNPEIVTLHSEDMRASDVLILSHVPVPDEDAPKERESTLNASEADPGLALVHPMVPYMSQALSTRLMEVGRQRQQQPHRADHHLAQMESQYQQDMELIRIRKQRELEDLQRRLSFDRSHFVYPVSTSSTHHSTIPISSPVSSLGSLTTFSPGPAWTCPPSHSQGLAICKACNKEAKFYCSACMGAHYCSVECQRVDWLDHSKQCVNP